MGRESNVDTVRAVFERLVPDAAARDICANVFSETIEQAHAAGEGRWEITLQSDMIRLNGGRVLIVDARPEGVSIGVDSAKVDAPTLNRLEEVQRAQRAVRAAADVRCFVLPPAELPELWPHIRDGFRSFVAEAVLTARQCVWSRYHAPAVVEYLSSIVGRALPQPVHGGVEDERDSEERGVYWVNEGQSFDPDGPNDYLFAPRRTPEEGRLDIGHAFATSFPVISWCATPVVLSAL